ncbi:MAG: hypothetical protein JWN76_350 [Chitinophagaceae bacterium]|nr:hypothetical protein [Chitinophagaceae bacterium]
MRILCLAILLLLLTLNATAQYYLRGEVKDDKGNPLYNVKILLQSKGSSPFYSGSAGAFGIPLSRQTDSIMLSLEGYEIMQQRVDAAKFQSFCLKPSPQNISLSHHHLTSVTKDLLKDKVAQVYHSNESYSNNVENAFVNTGKYPETGFALNIDRASYSNIRRFINMGSIVPPDAVRLEEMLNYFNLEDESLVTNKDQFNISTYLTTAPWTTTKQLFFVNIKAPLIDFSHLPPNNLTFLIDVSGSMDKPNRLPLLKSAFKLLVKNLRDKDTVAIVMYGGVVGVLLPPTSGGEKKKINDAIDKLNAEGDTPGEAAIRSAYTLAENCYNPLANNRIILATDGDFNVGQSSEKELEDLIILHRQSGIYLTCLGVGMGNYKDSKLEVLAKKGNGNFAYLDNINEAGKVLITEFSKTMYAVADDAFANVEFDPDYVKEYRLVGFDNKEDALNDSSSKIEGGEIGTGHALIAVFEIVPTEKNIKATENKERIPLATVRLQYKPHGKDTPVISNFPAVNNLQQLSQAKSFLRLAATICMFGNLVKQSPNAKEYNWDDLTKIAVSAGDIQNPLHKEFLGLIDKAKKIYRKKKKD